MKRKLFVDLNGVAADFDTGYFNAFGIRPSISDDNVDWSLVRGYEGFYLTLPKMPDFDELWAGIAHLEPTFLTGCPKEVPEAVGNKLEWVVRACGGAVPFIGCASKDKSLYMSGPGDILIDDWEKYRHLWEAKGGVWITHRSAAESLSQLAAVFAGDAHV